MVADNGSVRGGGGGGGSAECGGGGAWHAWKGVGRLGERDASVNLERSRCNGSTKSVTLRRRNADLEVQTAPTNKGRHGSIVTFERDDWRRGVKKELP